jgi:hypothetical protein
MNWLGWLGLALVVTAVAAVTGIQPEDARPGAQSRMIGMARFVLVGLVVILVYFAFQAHAGG